MNKNRSRNAPESRSLKSSLKTQDEIVETLIVIPPDGGWGWVVVIVSFCFNFLADGIMFTFGIFLKEIAESFKTSQTSIALANSLMSGFYYLLGPLASGLVNRYGIRPVAIVGGTIATVSILICSFLQDLYLFLVIYGFFGGLGFCMTYVTSIIVVGFYFEKWRALATCIAACGSSSSVMVFPAIMDILLSKMPWRPKFRVIAGSCFVVTMMGIVYFPLKPQRIISMRSSKSKSVTFGRQSIEVPATRSGCVSCKQFFKAFHNKQYPTTAEIHLTGNDEGVMLVDLEADSETTLSLDEPNFSFKSIKSIKDPRSRLSRVSTWQSEGAITWVDEIEYPANCCRRCLFKCCYACKHCCRSRETIPARPLYRDDIFYGGSLVTLPEYSKSMVAIPGPARRSTVGAMNYSMSVTRVATVRDLQEDHMVCICCPESMLRTMATMLDMSLLKSPSFLMLATSGFFTVLGMYSPFIYMESRALAHGMRKEDSVLLLSVTGISNIFGRILGGIISSLPHMKATIVSYVSLFISGLATVLSFWSFSVVFQYSYCSLFGMTVACFGSLRPIIVVELLGIEKLTNAFGVSMTFQGLACFLGLPISTLLLDYTDDYNVCFYFAGSSVILSAILLIPMKAVSKWEESHIRR